VRKVAHHCIISFNCEEIQEFCKGLSCGGVLDILKLYHAEAKAMLMHSDDLLDVNDFKAVFKPNYSSKVELVSLEEDIVFNFHNFLDEVSALLKV